MALKVSMEEELSFKPPVPANISKEHIVIWTGWYCKGDKEVSREAAAKGISVDLVELFISLRKNISLKEAHNFFKNEVLLWVEELLDRKQIFRVSHVLKNIGLDPDKELLKVFASTTKRDLREYIGNHLIKLGELSNDMQQLWCFLNLIMDNNVLVSKYKLSVVSIDCLSEQSEEWKQEVAAKLFLRTNNVILVPFLRDKTLWKQLLLYNDTKLLKAWINAQYNETVTNLNIPECILNVFKLFSITSDMINHITACNISSNTCAVVLNELAKFGIFSHCDTNDFINILRRADDSNGIHNIYQILSSKHSNLSIVKFQRLLVDYCLKLELYHVLNVCLRDFDLTQLRPAIKSPHLDLMLCFRRLTSDVDEAALCDNIFKVSCYLSDDLVDYFKENTTILLALILFHEHAKFSTILCNNSFAVSDIELFEAISQLMSDFKVLRSVHRRMTVPEPCTLTFYDLLQKHMDINVKELFSFQFGTDSIPHFNTTTIVQKYGYSKRINYLFYVKALRPSKACKLFLLEQYQTYSTVNKDSMKVVQKKIYDTAVRNFSNSKIVTSCVAFLEMIGVSGEPLKVAIKSANLLHNFDYDYEFVLNLFLHIHDDPFAILKLLETKIIESIDFDDISNPDSFVKAIQQYDILIKFSVHYNLKLPEMFLKQCAGHNMWLPFLIFAQIKNYPITQIKAALQSLRNPNLLEHIHHSVVHDIQLDERNVLMREHDSRTSFLSRIGVHRSVDSVVRDESLQSSIASQTSYGSGSSSMGSDSLEIDILNTKTTLAQTLIRCHNSTDPPKALLQACQLYRNPLLAILATSYEPDSIITNWLTWLAVSMESYQTFTNFESIATSAISVAELLNRCVKNRFLTILHQSFAIFLPENPLHHFTAFLCSSVNFDFNPTLLKSKLDAFKDSLNRCRRYSVMSKSDLEMTYLKNRSWIESTSILLLSSTIEFNFTSLHEQILFVRCLRDVGIQQYIGCSEVQSVLDVLTLLTDSKCRVRFSLGSYFDIKGAQSAIVDCMNQLLEQELFDLALKVAEIANVPSDEVLVRQCEHEYKNSERVDKNFWGTCSAKFATYNVSDDRIIEFFLEYSEKVENSLEKYQLLKLAYEWANRSDHRDKYNIEKRKWKVYILLNTSERLEDLLFEPQPAHITYKEMLETIALIPEANEDNAEVAASSVEELIKRALSEGNFWQALKLERMFGCRCQDLDMLKISHGLAEGLLLPYQLDSEQRMLLNVSGHYRRLSHRRTFLSNRLTSLSSASLTPENVSYLPSTDVVDGTPLQDTLTLLYMLVEKVTVGADIAYRIFMMYRISLNIEIPYHVIVSNTDHMKMLKDALEDDCMHKLDVIHDFMRVYRWSSDKITDFICEEIVNTASKYVRSKSEEFVMWNLKMDQEFHLVLQLLQDHCSLLGIKIYSYATAIHKVQVSANLDFRISELALVVELLITAHHCFTADCNMEGISTVLKTCRTVIAHLLTLLSWKLIVRLLTGVGRYTEMSYVFDILRENDQFEFLLRKGSKRDGALKVALLDYLKKYCPDNRDLYKIVALHFALFSEVAVLWEREAQGVVRNLIAISKLEMQNNRLDPDLEPYVLLTNTDGTKLCLNKAIENYTHATEFHLQGEKLAKAMHAAKQAELIALQMSLLKGLPSNGTAVCLLNVGEAQVLSLISKELSFDQSLILVQAYGYIPDWATVLFEQCILRGNVSYLRSFLKHLPLRDGLVHDISRKFLLANINTPDEIASMKEVLRNVSSVHTKYRIASEMGFTDLVEDLIAGGQLAYLKDTVWKKGYKG